VTDPFAAPAVVPSTFPSAQSFNGRLIIVKPRESRMIPDKQTGEMKPRITADVTVVDGGGPVPLWSNYEHNGQFLDGPDFTGVYFGQQRIITQLADSLKSGVPVLARMGLRYPDRRQGQGNPWNLDAPTDADRATATQFLATRTVAATAAPAQIPVPTPQAIPQPAPQAQAAPVYAPQPVAQQMPPQAPPAPVQLPTPGSAPAGANPFA
jgi:hypothetical protein